MKRWIIEGGVPLKGEISVSGAKNVAFKLMIAALLGQGETILENVPRVGDVHLAVEMIRYLGGEVVWLGEDTLAIYPDKVDGCTLPVELARQSRASFMFVGPLLNRCEEVFLPLPGGDRIGRRPLDRHIAGLKALGAEVVQQDHGILVRGKLRGTRFILPKNTHTGTETLILAAVNASGETILENAAQEPEVDDMISFLQKMGAGVQRVAPRTIIIQGGQSLRGVRHRIMNDRNEAVSFACMALATKGDVHIRGINKTHIQAFLALLPKIKAGFSLNSEDLHIWFSQELQTIQVQTSPHPGIMSDWQPLLTTLMTQARGISEIHETVFENRFAYVEALKKMGARIELFNPPVSDPHQFYNFNWKDNQPHYYHAVRISGPCKLHGIPMQVTDVRAGATLVQAALTASGVSQMSGIEHIERGYVNLDERLRALGAQIQIAEL